MSASKTLLVTGHLGFIGSNFCRLFGDRYRIIGMDFKGFGALEENRAGSLFHDLRTDISDEKKLRKEIEGQSIDAIVNFAAESHVDRSNQDDMPFWKSNVLGARALANIAIERKIRLLHVSTDEVYGEALENSKPWTESSPVQPQNPYSVTKASAEWMLLAYRRTRGLDVVITRGANTIGPRQFIEKALPKAVHCFMHDEAFPLYRTPARRMWLYVDDHCEGVRAALERGESGEIYNIGPRFENEAYTHEVIQHVRERVGRGTIREVEDRKAYDLRYWMSSEKASQSLSWQSKHDWKSAVNQAVDWYLANPDWMRAAAKSLRSADPS